MFATSADGTIGRRLYDLGNGQWDIPALRVLLEEILPRQTTVEAYEVEHVFPDVGAEDDASQRPQGSSARQHARVLSPDDRRCDGTAQRTSQRDAQSAARPDHRRYRARSPGDPRRRHADRHRQPQLHHHVRGQCGRHRRAAPGRPQAGTMGRRGAARPARPRRAGRRAVRRLPARGRIPGAWTPHLQALCAQDPGSRQSRTRSCCWSSKTPPRRRCSTVTAMCSPPSWRTASRTACRSSPPSSPTSCGGRPILAWKAIAPCRRASAPSPNSTT